MGLPGSERIGRILIDPVNPDIVYAAVLGALWGDSQERGVYKTTDGGKSWNRLLYVNPSTGCADMAMDPDDPRLYMLRCGISADRHTPSGQEGRAADYTDQLTEAPPGIRYKTGCHQEPRQDSRCVSPVKPYYLYALVESEKSALYRSSTGHDWEDERQYITGDRPFYYSLIVLTRLSLNAFINPVQCCG